MLQQVARRNAQRHVGPSAVLHYMSLVFSTSATPSSSRESSRAGSPQSSLNPEPPNYMGGSLGVFEVCPTLMFALAPSFPQLCRIISAHSSSVLGALSRQSKQPLRGVPAASFGGGFNCGGSLRFRACGAGPCWEECVQVLATNDASTAAVEEVEHRLRAGLSTQLHALTGTLSLSPCCCFKQQ